MLLNLIEGFDIGTEKSVRGYVRQIFIGDDYKINNYFDFEKNENRKNYKYDYKSLDDGAYNPSNSSF